MLRWILLLSCLDPGTLEQEDTSSSPVVTLRLGMCKTVTVGSSCSRPGHVSSCEPDKAANGERSEACAIYLAAEGPDVQAAPHHRHTLDLPSRSAIPISRRTSGPSLPSSLPESCPLAPSWISVPDMGEGLLDQNRQGTRAAATRRVRGKLSLPRCLLLCC